jgi:hypothetical protein
MEAAALFVGGLPYEATSLELAEAFRSLPGGVGATAVDRARIVFHRGTVDWGQSLCSCCVIYMRNIHMHALHVLHVLHVNSNYI